MAERKATKLKKETKNNTIKRRDFFKVKNLLVVYSVKMVAEQCPNLQDNNRKQIVWGIGEWKKYFN